SPHPHARVRPDLHRDLAAGGAHVGVRAGAAFLARPCARKDRMIAVGAVLAGYLVGTLPTGLLVARARGVDIRTVGSGNIGATNVARALGKKLGGLVLAVDALKGFLPTFLAARAGLAPEIVAAVGLATILGHIFPLWLRFRGGKGVATGLGVFLAVAPV